MNPPADAGAILSKYVYKMKHNQNGELARRKSHIVVKGFRQADAGEDEAAPSALLEPVHLLIAIVAQNGFGLKQAAIKTAFLHAGTPMDAGPISFVLRKKRVFSGSSAQVVAAQGAALRAALSPKDGWGIFHDYLMEIGFVQSMADPCFYILSAGGVLLLVFCAPTTSFCRGTTGSRL